jgi:putative FmdB family regulatory protein
MQGWNESIVLSNTEVPMPIYTYQCNNCGVRFERQQKFSEAPLTRCPECSKKALRKIFTPVGIVFKGSGFYSTDHRSPSGASRTKESPKSEGEDKTAVKSEPTKSENAG